MVGASPISGSPSSGSETASGSGLDSDWPVSPDSTGTGDWATGSL